MMQMLTDGDFVLLPQHDVAWCQVAVDDPLFLVQITQRQTHLWHHKYPLVVQSENASIKVKSLSAFAE